MFDSGLAALHKRETKRLKESVNRNIKRFPKILRFNLPKKPLKI